MSPRPKGSKGVKSDETREKIYTSAMALFQAKGFTDTTMRQIAESAGVATGAAYYYFRSKDDIVFRFYRETQARDRALLESPEFQAEKDLEERLRRLFRHKLEQLQDHRHFLDGVFRNANDPDSPLSPFSEETRDIREANIRNIETIIAGSNAKVDKSFATILPRALWMYQMGIILFWFYDRSPQQMRSRELLDKSLKLILLGLRMANLPLIAPLRRRALDLIQSFVSLLEPRDAL